MGLKWLFILTSTILLGLLKHVISVRQLAYPNRGHSRLPYMFWSSHEDLIDHQSEVFSAH